MVLPGIGGDLGGPQPWWVRAIVTVGAPTVISLGLVYLMAQILIGDIRLLRENLQLHHEFTIQLFPQVTANGETLEHLRDVVEDHSTREMLLLQQFCVNVADTAAERAGCFKQP